MSEAEVLEQSAKDKENSAHNLGEAIEQGVEGAEVADGAREGFDSGNADNSSQSSSQKIRSEPEKIDPVPLDEDRKLPDNPELKRILKLEVPIIVRLAEKTMRLGEVLEFIPGTIIEFEKTVDEELDLMINNKCIGKGKAAKIGENFGLKVTDIETIERIIKALGGE